MKKHFNKIKHKLIKDCQKRTRLCGRIANSFNSNLLKEDFVLEKIVSYGSKKRPMKKYTLKALVHGEEKFVYTMSCDSYHDFKIFDLNTHVQYKNAEFKELLKEETIYQELPTYFHKEELHVADLTFKRTRIIGEAFKDCEHDLKSVAYKNHGIIFFKNKRDKSILLKKKYKEYKNEDIY